MRKWIGENQLSRGSKPNMDIDYAELLGMPYAAAMLYDGHWGNRSCRGVRSPSPAFRRSTIAACLHRPGLDPDRADDLRHLSSAPEQISGKQGARLRQIGRYLLRNTEEDEIPTT